MSKDTHAARETAGLIAEAASAGLFSDMDTQAALDLSARLARPVRLTVLSADAVARDNIVKLIFRDAPVSTAGVSGAVQFVYGPAFSCRSIKSDRSEVVLDDPAGTAQLTNEKLIFTEIACPNDLLNKVSILSLPPPEVAADFEAALTWILSRTEILVWYSEDWTEQERQFWSMMPRAFRDHTHLCIAPESTGIDPSAARQIGFRSATRLDVSACRQLTGQDVSEPSQLRASGAFDLLVSIRKDIEAAKRETEDRLALLLDKYPGALDAARAGLETKRESPAGSEGENGNGDNAAPTSEAYAEPSFQATGAPASDTPPIVTTPDAFVRYDLAQLVATLETLSSRLQGASGTDAKLILRDAGTALLNAAEEMKETSATCRSTAYVRSRVEEAGDVLNLISFESDLTTHQDSIDMLRQIVKEASELDASIRGENECNASDQEQVADESTPTQSRSKQATPKATEDDSEDNLAHPIAS